MRCLVSIILLVILGACGNEPKNTELPARSPAPEVKAKTSAELSDRGLSSAQEKAAIRVVSDRLGSNNFGIEADDLRSMKNPKGEGDFVYVEKTRFHGSKRNIIWMVIDGKAYPLNGSTQGIITPTLPWPREAPNSSWEKTGLNKYMATEAIEIVWGKQ